MTSLALNPRQHELVESVRLQGFATVEALAATFEVTTQTIRRDLATLCQAGLLRRYHGGVSLPLSTENLTHQARTGMQAEEKRRIAAVLAEHIPDGASLFINLGTTNECVARALLARRELRIITNSLHVAIMLSSQPGFEVIVAGGVVRGRDHGVTGEATIDLIRQFKVDYGIIGISGIEPDGSLMDYDFHEVRVAQTIIQHSRQIYLAADASKVGRKALVRLGSFADIDAWFTDAPPPPRLQSELAQLGTQVHVAAG